MNHAMTPESLDASSTPTGTIAPSGPATRAIWIGRVVSGLAVLFLTFDAAMKLLRLPAAVDGTVELGYPADSLATIGLIQVVCLFIYLIPRTAVLGALLWTGYLGGAVATHFRLGNPLFTHMLFPTYVAAMIWGGLWLRDSRVRGLFDLHARS